MQRRIFFSIFIGSLSLLFLANLFLIFSLESFFQKESLLDLKNQSKHLIEQLPQDLTKIESLLQSLKDSHYRISIMDKRGNVLYDSLKKDLENHIKREEIQNALLNGESTSIRYSDTLGAKTLYYAVFLKERELILRIAKEQKHIKALVSKLLPYFFLEFFLALLLCFLLARFLTKAILKPILKVDLEHLKKDSLYFELHSFVKKIKSQNKVIKTQLKHLRQKQQEMLLLAENMSDGLILLNQHGDILSTNKSVQKYFKNLSSHTIIYGLEETYFLQTLLNLLKGFKKNKGGESKTLQMQLSNFECEVIFTPIFAKNKCKGMVIVVRDITQAKLAQNLRKEFSANVTHELKTPLTSILASSEMLKNNLVKKEDIPSFLDKIFAESTRLLGMIDEILKLSFFDEGGEENLQKQKISLKSSVLRVVERLKLIATQYEVQIIVNLEECFILGEKSLVENLIFNLIDNAIKYNFKGGF
ncbi:MAG: two-component sensor histidine kinase, partial [Helicobacter sp.]|nr:two-component sensor histidine kinase [Helicobacter sp.]